MSERKMIYLDDAIDALNYELQCGAYVNYSGLETAIDIVTELPPAEPVIRTQMSLANSTQTNEERKTGKWTKAYDGYDGHVSCTSCFKIYDWDSQAQYYKYCPNCGCRMSEVSE